MFTFAFNMRNSDFWFGANNRQRQLDGIFISERTFSTLGAKELAMIKRGANVADLI